MRHTKLGARGRGFTLTELLVVLSIIVMLAALLVAVFARVRERSHRLTCQSNLRQLGLAFQIYNKDYDSRYPQGGYVWVNGQAMHQYRLPLELDPYIKSPAILLCPDQVHDSLNLDFAYNLRRVNGGLPPTANAPNGSFFGHVESVVTKPADIWILRDAQGGHNIYDPIVANRPCPWCPQWGTLHSGAGNYLFADGHVQWLTPDAITAIETANGRPGFVISGSSVPT